MADSKNVYPVDRSQEIDSTTIMKKIEKHTKKGVPFIDAIIAYAEEDGLEIEILGEIIRRSPVLKSKVYDEAVDLNMVEKIARLPI
jgi:predicted aldo/keto reductase-like oxidoreductase